MRKDAEPMLNGRTQVLKSKPNGTGSRVASVDLARGLALGGMALFHLNWDLAYLHWRQTGPADSPAWMMFGNLVAGTFLCLSGVGLVLAERSGRRSALRRLALIAAAALAITAVTGWLFPQDYIFFGILHCIAVTNLIALPFLDASLPVLVGVAALAAVAPRLLSSARFDGSWGWWSGLSQALPRTLDYRPVLPWLGAVLLGVALARVLFREPPYWQPKAALARAVALAGRHSLFIYLTHQPVLLGLLLLVGLAWPPAPPNWVEAFSRQCRAECTAAGAGEAGCKAACDCVQRGLTPMLGAAEAKAPLPLHTPTRQELDRISAACLRAEDPVLDGESGTGAGR